MPAKPWEVSIPVMTCFVGCQRLPPIIRQHMWEYTLTVDVLGKLTVQRGDRICIELFAGQEVASLKVWTVSQYV